MESYSRRTAIGVATGGLLALSRAAQAAATYDVPVAAFYPMSGANSGLGANAQSALQATVELVHGDYDLDLPMARSDFMPRLPGARLKLIMEDHANDPARAVLRARKLIAEDKVVALIGAANDLVADALSELADDAKIPFLDADSSSTSLRAQNHKFTFRFAADDKTRASTMLDFLASARDDGGPKLSAITLLQDKGQEDVAAGQMLRDAAAASGLKIAGSIPHMRGRPEIATRAAMEQSSRSDAFVLLGSADDAIKMRAAMRASHVSTPLICFPTITSDRSVQPYSAEGDGLFVVRGFARDGHENAGNIAAINTLYRSIGHSDLNELSALQFTAFLTLAFAMNVAASRDPTVVAQRMSIERFPGFQTILPWRELAFDSKGINTGAKVVVAQYTDEKSLTVYPRNVASGAPRWRV